MREEFCETVAVNATQKHPQEHHLHLSVLPARAVQGAQFAEEPSEDEPQGHEGEVGGSGVHLGTGHQGTGEGGRVHAELEREDEARAEFEGRKGRGEEPRGHVGVDE